MHHTIASSGTTPSEPCRVACLGPVGTYSEDAAIAYFGPTARRNLFSSLDEIFEAVETGAVHHAVAAVENTNEGSVTRTLDLLAASSAKVCGELSLDIRHNLLTQSGRLESITCVRAHAQALAQCHGWLTARAPHLKREAVLSNAEAARLAATDPTAAAIAGARTASEYGLQVAYAAIQDDALNRTRFLILGPQDAPHSPKSKTSLIISVKNEPGALYKAVEPFYQHGVSMSRFESRPSKRGVWEYLFYIDLVGHRSEPAVASALAALAERAQVKMLGSYPASKEEA